MLNIKISFRGREAFGFNLETGSLKTDCTDNKKTDNKKPKKNTLAAIESQLEDLVVVTKPDNYETLLDIASTLYSDEISRYRFLEDKGSRLLTLITFLLPATISILYWIYTSNSASFNIYVLIPVVTAFCFISLSLFFILKSYSITQKPSLVINDQLIKAAATESFQGTYKKCLVAYRDSYEDYRKANIKKSGVINWSHKLLIYYFISCGFILLFILLGLASNLVNINLT